MKTRIINTLVIALLACAGFASAGSLKFTLQNGTGEAGAAAKTELTVAPGKGLGAFQLNITYDPKVIEPDSVEPADGINALVDYNVLSPGTIRVAFASSSGVQADGAVVLINWEVISENKCTLGISELRAWEQETSYELPVIASNGEFTGVSTDASTTKLGITGLSLPMILGIGLGAIIAILLLILVIRKPAK